MKANELRIGNLLSVNWKNDLVIVTGEIINEVENYEHEYHPIQLTEEWLMKFGFKLYGESYWKGNFKYNSIQCFEYFGIPIHDSLIRYVHQLQNLHFTLTGEELTIK